MSTRAGSVTLPQPAQGGSAKYGDKVLAVEPFGVEPVPDSERHGATWQQFTLWLGSNLTIADFALGFLPVALGLPWVWSIVAILVGNAIGALALGLSAAMGPTYGVPQLIISRYAFGRIGGYLPAALNYVSTIGWFTVNNILGTFGLRVLFPHLAFWQGAVFLVVMQGLLAIYGHNLIHMYERVISIVLGALFVVATVISLRHPATLALYHPHGTALWPMFAIMVAAAFSYIGSWSSYASDYSRYLRADVSKARVVRNVFFGSFIASVWLELVGLMVAVLAGSRASDPIAALHLVMGGFGTIAVIAIILGGTAADALNLYSNALSAGAFDIRVPRWVLALAASAIGLTMSLLGAGHFETNYDDFLLLLGYWITPWLGVLFADYYFLRRHRATDVVARQTQTQPIVWQGLISFLVGIGASVPFMNAPHYVGPVAKALGGTDLTFYVGFVVAAVVYMALTPRRRGA